MTNSDCTVSSAVSKNTNYPTQQSNVTNYRIAEDADDNQSGDINRKTLPQEIKCCEVWSLEMAMLGQIERLNKLSCLLRRTHPDDRTIAQLNAYAREIRNTGRQMETFLYKMVHTLVDEPRPEDDDSSDSYGFFTEDDD